MNLLRNYKIYSLGIDIKDEILTIIDFINNILFEENIYEIENDNKRIIIKDVIKFKHIIFKYDINKKDLLETLKFIICNKKKINLSDYNIILKRKPIVL